MKLVLSAKAERELESVADDVVAGRLQRARARDCELRVGSGERQGIRQSDRADVLSGHRVALRVERRVMGSSKAPMTSDAQRYPQHREALVLAFSQERKRIVKKLWQIRQDIDSYNENVNPSDPIAFVFDFTNDVDELEAARKAKHS